MYPLYKVYVAKKDDIFVVRFTSPETGVVIAIHTPESAYVVGDDSDDWIEHSDKTIWDDYANINQYIKGVRYDTAK